MFGSLYTQFWEYKKKNTTLKVSFTYTFMPFFQSWADKVVYMDTSNGLTDMKNVCLSGKGAETRESEEKVGELMGSQTATPPKT